MQVIDIMHRARIEDIGMIVEFIKDAYLEIQRLSAENEVEGYISIVSGVEDYHFPAGMVNLKSFNVNDNDDDSYNEENWAWEVLGRNFKLYMLDAEGLWSAPTISVTDGIELRYTTKGYSFVYNPDGDATYYDHKVSDGTVTLVTDEVVFVDEAERADYGQVGYYYKYIGTGESADLSATNFKDTTAFTDVTEVTSPDSDSYLGGDEQLWNAVFMFVKAKIADFNDNLKLHEYRMAKFRHELYRIGVSRRIDSVPGQKETFACR